MPRLFSVAVTAVAALLGAGPIAHTDVGSAPSTPQVTMIEDATLRDVAVAVYDSVRPVIYLNPRLMQRFSPDLQAFFMAHEYAHIELKHTRAGALRADVGTRDQLLQLKELEADCLAARRLGPQGRQAAMAAVRFFGRLGTTQFDTEHPTGTVRARRILDCLAE
jgi:Zn-dependent protease with chaperone function